MGLRDSEKVTNEVTQIVFQSAMEIKGGTPFDTLWLAQYAAEALKHFDENDECSIVIKSSKKDGLQIAVSGCIVHGLTLINIAAIHAQVKLEQNFKDKYNEQQLMMLKGMIARIALICSRETEIIPLDRPTGGNDHNAH